MLSIRWRQFASSIPLQPTFVDKYKARRTDMIRDGVYSTRFYRAHNLVPRAAGETPAEFVRHPQSMRAPYLRPTR